jgi:hypothetical protein
MLGERHDVRQVVDVLPMEDGVEGEGKAQLLHPACDHQLAFEGPPPRDPIGAGGLRVLYGDLDIVEAELAESRELIAARGMPLVMRFV